MIEYKVSLREENQRIDKFLRKYLNEAPLSFIYKLFRKKDVKVNGHWVKQDYILKRDELISIYVTDEQLKEFSKPKELQKEPFKYQIIYEDENILVVNKPRGLLVHGDASEKRNTLSNEVLNYLYFKGEYNPRVDHGFIPGPAHRLDRNTSGLVVFGKNLPTLQLLEDLFKDKTDISKIYCALVNGNLDHYMEVDLPLLKDPNSGLVKVAKMKDGAKSALTKVTPIEHIGDMYTLVNVELVTGRTHQIRVHLSNVGYPVVGDGKYGDFKSNRYFKDNYKFENQFLHAEKIMFKNIKKPLDYLSGKTFIAPLAKEEKELLNNLKS
ncbi:MAG: RluA family pseudouridine synthase [Bacilli bacterium]|nr:RluA family pseudouridine synthase [Bacilli bacterium]